MLAVLQDKYKTALKNQKLSCVNGLLKPHNHHQLTQNHKISKQGLFTLFGYIHIRPLNTSLNDDARVRRGCGWHGHGVAFLAAYDDHDVHVRHGHDRAYSASPLVITSQTAQKLTSPLH